MQMLYRTEPDPIQGMKEMGRYPAKVRRFVNYCGVGAGGERPPATRFDIIA